MRKIILTSMLLVSLVSLIFFGCDKAKNGAKDRNNNDIGGALRVATQEAKIGRIVQTIDNAGMVQGYREVSVVPGMSSWIVKIYVKEGQWVNEGQLLARLSPEQLEQVAAQLRAAEDNYNRMKNLLEQKSISQQQFDQIEAAYKATKAMYDLTAKNTELRAPFSGTVASIDAKEGQFFNAMMTLGSEPSIVKIVDQRKVKVEVYVSARDIVKVKQGQKVYLRTDAYVDTVFEGEIESAEQIADAMSGTYKVTAVFPNNSQKLRSGMHARINIAIAEADSALIIPQSAIVEDTLVFVAEGNQARSRRVTLGIQSDSLAQVISGIEIGEKVIIIGTLALYDGAPIAIKNGDAVNP